MRKETGATGHGEGLAAPVWAGGFVHWAGVGRSRLFSGLMIAWLGCVAAVAAPGYHTRAELVVSHEEARAGEEVRVGVRLEMDPNWHTYWVNPGDAGGPTVIRWELPEGWEVGELDWPLPEVMELEGIYTYGYYGEVVLSAPLLIPAGAAPGLIELRAKVEWLECFEICLPGEAEVRVQLLVGSSTRPSRWAALFESTQAQVPRRGEPEGLRSWWGGEAVAGERPLVVEWRGAAVGSDFLGYAGTAYEVKVPTEVVRAREGMTRIRKQVRAWEEPWPGELEGVLVVRRSPAVEAYRVQLRPLAGEGGGSMGRETAAAEAGGPVRGGLALMLAFGLFGGLVLNVMPCVLPVIALKVLGFVRQAEAEPGLVRRHGLIYGLGVLASFAVLAGLVIAVQWGGQLASWGMQFQSAGFLLVMTTLVVLVALNLFGVFEVTLGGRTLGAASALASRQGDAGAFFNGVLATTLATPCTAPFLGTAVGYAFAQPRLVILGFFLVIGLGLALPYVVISFLPALGRWLPRPGAWMERFKVAMGFPMLGAGIWLLSLLTRHYGAAGVLWIGVFLLVVGFVAWMWGQYGQRSGRCRVGVAGVCAGLLAAGYWVVLEGQLDWRHAGGGSDSRKPGAVLAGAIPWQPWSREAVAAARADVRPVLVDFKADWCVTCQANKKTSLEVGAVRRKLQETGTVALLGDYTLRDEAITAELRRFGRAGVPLVLVYPRRPELPPIVLPELLTPGLVLEALDRAAQ